MDENWVTKKRPFWKLEQTFKLHGNVWRKKFYTWVFEKDTMKM